MPNERKRCCCNCGNRVLRECNSYCKIDGNYISYVMCFEGWCKHWCKDKKEVNNNAE